MIKKVLFSFVILFSFIFTACKYKPQNGDLLFVVAESSDFENAITESTAWNDSIKFAHVAILAVKNEEPYIIEASTKKGVTKTKWEDFLQSAPKINGKPGIVAMRIKKEYDDFIQCLSKFKISCFSTSPYLNRMWSSAYGNNNQGFCIEYEIDVTTEEGQNLYNNIYPVIYSQHRNDLLQLSEHCDLSHTKEDLWQMFFNGLLRKSLHWQDQQEWRLILADGFIDKNPKPFFKIKRIYLGNKMPHKERIKIVNYCRKHTIPYVGLVRDKDSFNLIECEGDCYLCQCRKTEKS